MNGVRGVDIPELTPGIRFRRMTQADVDLAFEAKRAAMGPHIVARWPWDEAFQQDIHRRHFAGKPFYGIVRDGCSLGTLSFEMLDDYARFGEFYLLPAFQRAGTGSAILRHCLAMADAAGLPVRLEHLHWNPVGSLYRRHGFVETARNDIHVFMERAVAA